MGWAGEVLADAALRRGVNGDLAVVQKGIVRSSFQVKPVDVTGAPPAVVVPTEAVSEPATEVVVTEEVASNSNQVTATFVPPTAPAEDGSDKPRTSIWPIALVVVVVVAAVLIFVFRRRA